MKTIVYVGIDVHLNQYTICCVIRNYFEPNFVFGQTQIEPSSTAVLEYLKRTRIKLLLSEEEVEFICGYEAGFSGKSLCQELIDKGVICHLMAPSTMDRPAANRTKTDKQDAKHIANCLINKAFKEVYILEDEDTQVRDYIRMRNDQLNEWKRIKQQITAFCYQLDKMYGAGKSKWTKVHLDWLRDLNLSALHRETLDEYLISYRYKEGRMAYFDQRIEELANRERYRERVKQLSCFIGIRTHTALCLLSEIGNFERFESANQFASFLGLTPGEHSSGDSINRTGITKMGNRHLRRLLTESAQCFMRGKVGHKSKSLKARQKGNGSQIIDYADRANERLRRRYYKMIKRGKKRNVVVSAIARELSCFVWGMMTGHLEARAVG